MCLQSCGLESHVSISRRGHGSCGYSRKANRAGSWVMTTGVCNGMPQRVWLQIPDHGLFVAWKHETQITAKYQPGESTNGKSDLIFSAGCALCVPAV